MLRDTGKSSADARGPACKTVCKWRTFTFFFIPSFADISEPLNSKLFFSTVGHVVDQLGAWWFHPDVTAHQRTIFAAAAAAAAESYTVGQFLLFSACFSSCSYAMWQFLCHPWPIWRSQWDSLPFPYPPAVQSLQVKEKNLSPHSTLVLFQFSNNVPGIIPWLIPGLPKALNILL